ncbi:5'/3'-nucleotidase SurE [Pseudothermotoga thermarum]|uniref:5'-nucleotidase SurE n=1 Tax=Pseudothermotoga thermarum DSM 5069 TaxID=688269 RepID=F7YYU1_9THEM|nr:5'/3'-nucleotidase SurE [Pseudothermotoga thermarum]AEH51129.1 5'-nucleotidase; exopolyphosphatase; 3'-nucleotidase [Pseudothermotoga thermarum DSM 5069]
MKVLITNDDGVTSIGLITLAKVFSKEHEVLVVAPESEQSATGHAITVRMPIWVKRVKVLDSFPVYAATGTPADCVKIGVEVLAKGKVDLVLSGINIGHNLGTDVVYSGTVSGALEGALLGIPSIALSAPISENFDFEAAARFILNFVRNFDFNLLEKFCALNVNFPEGEIKGWKATKQSKRRYADKFEERKDPSGNTYYWMYGDIIEDDTDPDADYIVVKSGYVSITPISVFMMHKDVFERLKEVEKREKNKIAW